MNRTDLRRIGWGAYGVAFLLIVIPLLDSLLGVWPLRVGEVTWRFGAVGLFSRAVLTPLLGLLIGLVTAVYLEHRVAARVLSALSFVGVALAVTAIGFFALDALQTRSQVRPESAGAFDTAATVAAVKYLLGMIVALLLGIGGWKASRKRRARPGVEGGPRRPTEESRVLLSKEEGRADR